MSLFKMVVNQTQCSKLELRPVIKSLVAEKCKLCEIYLTICDVFVEARVSYRNVSRWDKL